MSQLVLDLKCLKDKIATNYDIHNNVYGGNGMEPNIIHPSERFRMVVRLVDFLFCESDEEFIKGFFCQMIVRNLHCLDSTNGAEEMHLYMSERLFSAHKDDLRLINGQVLDVRIGVWYGIHQSLPIFEIIDFKILSRNDVRDFCEFVKSPLGEKFLNISNS